MLITVLICVVLLGLACNLLWPKDKSQPDVRTDLPRELAGQRIWHKEKQFSSRNPPLIGRIDEAFIDSKRVVTISDTKSRKVQRVFESDILQLSGYKAIVEDSGANVSPYGYIRLITPAGNVYKRVELLDSRQVAAATTLYQELSEQRYPGRKCSRIEVCRSCAYKPECDKMPS